MATGSGIDPGAAEDAPRAAAGKAQRLQSPEGSPVTLLVVALADDRAVPMQLVCVEGSNDRLLCSRIDPRRIDVVDAKQPLTAGGVCIKPRRECGHERTEMQRPGGCGREPPDVGWRIGHRRTDGLGRRAFCLPSRPVLDFRRISGTGANKPIPALRLALCWRCLGRLLAVALAGSAACAPSARLEGGRRQTPR